jgi:ABC-type sugar transport system ATPase subunit
MNFITGELTLKDGSLSFRRGSWSLPLSKQAASQIQERVGGRVVLGIRPEDISIGTGPGEQQGVVAGTVAVVEPLGDATLITLTAVSGTAMNSNEGDGHGGGDDSDRSEEPFNMLSKIEPRSGLQPGDRVWAALDVERAHLFDPDCGENLLSEAVGGD